MLLPIATPRLVLRRPALHDAKRLQALLSPWDMAKWLTIPYPYTDQDARYWIETGCQTSGVHPNVYLQDVLIGGVGLTHHSDGSHELGYWLADTHQGQGYAFEAASLFLKHAMQYIPITSLHAKCLVDNYASSRLLGKLGFIEYDEQEVYRLPWRTLKTCKLFRFDMVSNISGA